MKGPLSNVSTEPCQRDLVYIASAVAFIRRHYQKTINERDIAKAAGTCERHLRRLFHRHFSLTPSKFLREYRLAKARDLLLETNGDCSVKEVAYDCGYSDPSHFSRTFKSLFGVAPDAIRKHLKGNNGRKLFHGFGKETMDSTTLLMDQVLADPRIQIIHHEELKIKGGGFVENNHLLRFHFEWNHPRGFLGVGIAGTFKERQFHVGESPKYPCVSVCLG